MKMWKIPLMYVKMNQNERKSVKNVTKREKSMKNTKAMLVWFFLLIFLVGCGQTKDPAGEEKAQLPDNFFNQEGTGVEAFSNYCLNSSYDDPKNVDLEELFYSGFGLELDKEDKDFLVQQGANMTYDICKLPAEQMDQVLTKYFGLTLKETNGIGMEKFYHNAEKDIYYLLHNDSHACKIVIVEQETENTGNLKITYQKEGEDAKGTAVLKKVEEGYQFLSNQYEGDQVKLEQLFSKEGAEYVEKMNAEYQNWVVRNLSSSLERWFDTYQNGISEKVAVEENEDYTPETCADILYYKPEGTSSVKEVIAKMLPSYIEPLMKKSDNRSFVITEYRLGEMEVIELTDHVWLIPYLNYEVKYDGTTIAGTMEEMAKADPASVKDGYLKFPSQGSEEQFIYVLMEENGVYRLQNLEVMMK